MAPIRTSVNHVASIDQAITEESSDADVLSLNFIPVVDLRRFSQPELLYLSDASSSNDFCRFEEDLVLKIDRSSFKESAGSRRQTYYRLRLAPRKSEFQLNSTFVSSHSVHSPRLIRPIRPSPGTVDENSGIVRCLRDLFGVKNHDVKDVVKTRGRRKRSTETDNGMQISANEYKVNEVIVSCGKKREENGIKIDNIGALDDVEGSNDCEPRKIAVAMENETDLVDVGNQLISSRSSHVHSKGNHDQLRLSRNPYIRVFSGRSSIFS